MVKPADLNSSWSWDGSVMYCVCLLYPRNIQLSQVIFPSSFYMVLIKTFSLIEMVLFIFYSKDDS